MEDKVQVSSDFCVFSDVSLSGLTTFGIGGKARTVVCPRDTRETDRLLSELREQGRSWFALGRGSNVLAADGVTEEVIIRFDRHMAQIWRDKGLVRCQSGAPVKMVCDYMLNQGLSGGEFLAVLPGTAGGAAVGNSGCFGQEMSHVVSSVTAVSGGEVRTFTNRELEFSYRDSFFKSNRRWVVTEVAFEFTKGGEGSAELIAEMKSKKLLSQPVNAKSAGCIFKNTDGCFAARIVDGLGFKGFSVGGARVSDKHANFIVNTGGASFADVVTLIDIIKGEARRVKGVELVEEIAFLPYKTL